MLAKNRRALALYGAGHFFRKVVDRSMVTILEGAQTRVFTIWTNAAFELSSAQADVQQWPVPSLAGLRGTALGRVGLASYLGPNAGDVPAEWLAPMEEQFDAVLYLGPLSTITLDRPTPWRCDEPAWPERVRRANLQRPEMGDSTQDAVRAVTPTGYRGEDRIASRRLVAAMMSRFRRRTISATRSRPPAAASSTIVFSSYSARGLQGGEIAAARVQVLLDLREAALEPQARRRGIAALDGFGAALPRLEDPPQLFLVAHGIGPVGLDHQRVAPIARVLVAGEIGMDDPGDVAKQLAHGVGGEARRRLRRGHRRRRREVRRGAAVGDLLRQLAELGFGDVELELIELFVQRADLLLVLRREHVELALDAVGVRRAGVEQRLELGDPRAQSIEVVLGLVGTDERGHPGMIPARPQRGASWCQLGRKDELRASSRARCAPRGLTRDRGSS